MYPAIKSSFRIIIIFCTFFLFFSCKKNPDLSESNDTYEVIGLIINILDKSTPPPPPIDASFKETTDFRDSIIEQYSETIFKGENIVVAIEPEFKIGYKQISLENENRKNYHGLVDSLLSIEIKTPLDISKIKSKANISLIKAPQHNQLTQTETWERFDFLFNTSNVIFNQKNTRAVAIVGIASGRLRGESSLFFLKKINDKWRITNRKALNFS